jgi:hypothetical protein
MGSPRGNAPRSTSNGSLGYLSFLLALPAVKTPGPSDSGYPADCLGRVLISVLAEWPELRNQALDASAADQAALRAQVSPGTWTICPITTTGGGPVWACAPYAV